MKKLIYGIIIIIIFIIGLSGYNGVPRIEEETKGKLLVNFIDVGDKNATFIEFPDGKSALINSGSLEYGRDVERYIKKRKHKKIDYFILSNYDENNIGGAIKIVNSLKIGRIYIPEILNKVTLNDNLKNEIAKKGIELVKVKEGFSLFKNKDIDFRVLSPKESYYKNNSDMTIVIKLKYKNNNFLFMGDSGKRTMAEIYNKDIKTDVLRISKKILYDNISIKFIDKAAPLYIVTSLNTNKDTVNNKLSLDILPEFISEEDVRNVVFVCDGFKINKYF